VIASKGGRGFAAGFFLKQISSRERRLDRNFLVELRLVALIPPIIPSLRLKSEKVVGFVVDSGDAIERASEVSRYCFELNG